MSTRPRGRWGTALLILISQLFVVLSVSAQEDCSEFDDAFSYASRADIAYNQRLYNDAVLDYTCAIQLDPSNPDYFNGRGNSHYWLQNDRDARADYEQVLVLEPEASYAYNNLANLYSSIGDYEVALEYYTNAITFSDSTDEVPLVNRASLYVETGRYAEAEADLAQARTVSPGYPNTYLILAWLASLQNDTGGAAANYSEWITLTGEDSRSPQYIANRTYVTRLLTGAYEDIVLPLTAGDVVNISASLIDNDQRADPLLVLFDPSGQAVIADDDSGVNIDAVIADYVAEQTGEYRLWLGNSGAYYYEGVDGEIRLSIERRAADGEVVEAEAPATVPDNSTTEVVEVVEVEVEEGDVSFATFRLFAGAVAEVYTTEGDRLNLRSGPGLRFDIIGRMQNGERVTLIEGPRKQDGLGWWRIRTADGTEGWAVERVDEEQTLQMALIVGEDAVVISEGDSLNVRSGAGRANDIVVQLEDGATVTLLEVAPELVDGFQWWRVRLPDGREGWTVDRIEGDRTLVPAKELEGQE